MRNRAAPILVLALASFTQAGCELVGDLLELGFWVGVILVVVVVAVLAWIVRMIRGRGRRAP